MFALGMRPGEYVLGLVVAAIYALSASWCGIALRRFLLPSWHGLLAALASSVLALSVFLVLCEALGALGLFTRWALFFASVLAAAAATLLSVRAHERPRSSPSPPTAPTSPVEAALVAAAVVLALAPFLKRVASVYKRGMLEWDTHWYHAPVAARFTQTSDVTELHYVNNPPDSFLPFNAELVHAAGMLAMGRDVLSPLINVGWVALALAAAWCLGSVWRAGAPAVAAVALVVSTRVMVYASAGSVGNDLPGLALLLAAAALVANAPRSRSAVAVAGLAAGLAVGTKLTLVAPVLVLSVGLAVFWTRSRSWHLGAVFAGALLATGSFWYLRNAVRAHNPFPWFEIGIGRLTLPSSTTPPRDCGSTTVAHYLTDTDVLRNVFRPDLASAFGPRWAMLVGIAAVGVLVAARGTAMQRVFGAVALLSALAYLVTPATAGGPEGNPTCFEYNTRFSTPALALGLLGVALASTRWRLLTPAVVGTGLVLLLAANVPFTPLRVAAALAAALAAGTIVRLRVRVPLRAMVGAAAAAVAAVVAAGWPVQAHYYDHRYAEGSLPEPIEASVRRLQGMSDIRIALGGFSAHYALYDPDLSNWVEFPVSRGPHGTFRRITSCPEWHEALAEGRYDYVVTYNSYANRPPPETEWTRSYPGAARILHAGLNDLFELGTPTSDDGASGCPPG